MIYVISLHKLSYFKFVLFADDTNVCISHDSIKQIENIFNSELENLVIWFKTNKLSLNTGKTNFNIFQKKSDLYPNENIRLYIDNVQINRVQSTKFLGVVLDSKLTWNKHITEIENNILNI